MSFQHSFPLLVLIIHLIFAKYSRLQIPTRSWEPLAAGWPLPRSREAPNPFLHIATHRGVVVLPNYQVQVPAGRLVQINHHKIAKRTGLSRNTIRKWVRAPELLNQRTNGARPSTKSALSTRRWNRRSRSIRSRQNITAGELKHFFEQIEAEGYDGGYSQLTAFVRSWRCEQGNSLRAFVPLTFALDGAF